MTVADLLRGMLIESANDAAATLATRIGGTEANFVRAMNKRAKELGLKNTHYANPIGLDDPANYSTARDLVRLTLRARAFNFFRRTVAHEQVTLHSGDHERTLENRNGLVKLQQVNGVKTGHTQQAGYVLVASGRAQRDHADLGRAGRAERRRARGRHAQALRLGVPALPPRAPDLAERGARPRDDPLPPRRRARARGGGHGAALRGPPRPAPAQVRPARAGARSPARSRAATSWARSTSAAARRSWRRCRWWPPPTSRRPASASAPRIASRAPGSCSWSCSSLWPVRLVSTGSAGGPTAAVARAGSRRQHDHHRHPQHGDRQDARGAQLPARPPPPDGRADGDAGRQGRQRRARAQDARPAGDRHRARGRGDRHADRRAAHAALGAVGLRAHPRGVAHQHRGDRPDDRRADRDQRARAAGDRAGDRAVHRQAALPRPGRERVRVRGLAAARRRRRRLRAADPRAQAARRRLRGRHRRRPAAARGARGARRDLAERARGRGARRPRVQRRGGPRSSPCARWSASARGRRS